MDIASLQAYGYLVFIIFLVVGLYAYIYHLYQNRVDSDGVDYEQYSNMALHDDLDDTKVKSKTETKEK